jgi:hypothetical protein
MYFLTKSASLGKFWSVVQRKMVVNFTLFYFLPFGIFYDHLVYFVAILVLVYFSRFGVLYQEKSGIPVLMAGWNPAFVGPFQW